MYMEPFYPALYGRAQTASTRDPNTTVIEDRGHADFEEQDSDRMRSNAVSRASQFRQSSVKAYHSVRSYDSDVIMFKGASRGFQNRAFSPQKLRTQKSGSATISTSKDVSTITNARSQSGRPIALVKLNKEDQSNSSSHTTTQTVEVINSTSTPESLLVREQKLLQGKLMRSSFTPQSDFVNPLQSLFVHSNSFKQFPVEEANHTPSSGTPPSEVRSTRPQVVYKPFKQDSVKSIPSSKTNLPDLEVRPAATLLNMHQNSPDKDREISADNSKQKAKNSDIVLTSPAVVNQRLKAKFQFPFQNEPLSLLHSISSRMNSGPQNLCRTVTNDLLTFPIPRQPHDRNLMHKCIDEVSYRHKMVSLRKWSQGSNEVSSAPDSDIILTEENSICALRSQRRRQRQHRKSVTGKTTQGKNTENTDESSRICMKPISQVKVCVKGKAKTLNSFLPTQNNYTDKLSEMYFVE